MEQTIIKQISACLWYIGFPDQELKQFRRCAYTDDGVTYSCYLVDTGEGKLLVGTPPVRYAGQWMEAISSLTALDAVKWLAVFGEESDRTAVRLLLDAAPETTVIAGAGPLFKIRNYINREFRFVEIRGSRLLTLGGHAVSFEAVSDSRRSDTVVLLDQTERVLFPADVLGSFFAAGKCGAAEASRDESEKSSGAEVAQGAAGAAKAAREAAGAAEAAQGESEKSSGAEVAQEAAGAAKAAQSEFGKSSVADMAQGTIGKCGMADTAQGAVGYACISDLTCSAAAKAAFRRGIRTYCTDMRGADRGEIIKKTVDFVRKNDVSMICPSYGPVWDQDIGRMMDILLEDSGTSGRGTEAKACQSGAEKTEKAVQSSNPAKKTESAENTETTKRTESTENAETAKKAEPAEEAEKTGMAEPANAALPLRAALICDGFLYTQELADQIEAGMKEDAAREDKICVARINLNELGRNEALRRLEETDLYLFCAGEASGDVPKSMWDIVTSLKKKQCEGKKAAIFGNGNPDGAFTESVMERLDWLGFDLSAGRYIVQGIPEQADLRAAYEYGYDISCILRKIPNPRRPKLVKCLVCGEIFDASLGSCPVCGVGLDQCVPVDQDEAGFRENTDRKYLIIGGGTAAVSAAQAIRLRDETGSIDVLSAENYLPINRPMLTKDFGMIQEEPEKLLIHDAKWYADNRISLHLGTTATALDTEHKTVTAKRRKFAGCGDAIQMGEEIKTADEKKESETNGDKETLGCRVKSDAEANQNVEVKSNAEIKPNVGVKSNAEVNSNAEEKTETVIFEYDRLIYAAGAYSEARPVGSPHRGQF